MTIDDGLVLIKKVNRAERGNKSTYKLRKAAKECFTVIHWV